MAKYTIVREIDQKKWSEFVCDHPNGTIFQTPEMYDVYTKTKNLEPLLLCAADEDNRITGILLAVIQKQFSGFPGSLTARSIIWGGPLVKGNNKKILELILEEYCSLVKPGAVYSQFRNLWEKKEEVDSFEKFNFRYDDHLSITFDLTQPVDTLYKQMHKERRHNIRRAINKGTALKELTSKKDIDETYRLIEETYKRIKIPLTDRSLFEAAYTELFKKGMVKYFTVVNNGLMIGVRIVLCYKDLVYDWYAGSSYKDRNKYPNDFLPWEVILWCKRSGYKIFDFGGAGKPGKPYGVRDYKLRFGGRLVNFGRYEKVHNKLLMKIGETGFALKRKFF